MYLTPDQCIDYAFKHQPTLQQDYLQAHHAELMEKEKRVEEQNINPELEYDFTHGGRFQSPHGG